MYNYVINYSKGVMYYDEFKNGNKIKHDFRHGLLENK